MRESSRAHKNKPHGHRMPRKESARSSILMPTLMLMLGTFSAFYFGRAREGRSLGQKVYVKSQPTCGVTFVLQCSRD